MSFLLWYGNGDNDALNLGNPFIVIPAFAQISKVLNGVEGFDELQSVPGFGEQEVTDWWMGEVVKQAKQFKQDGYYDKIDEEAQNVIDDLASFSKGLKTPKIDQGTIARRRR